MSKKKNNKPIHENKFSKETISIIYPNDFTYYPKLNALIPETVFGMEYLEKNFPDYIDISEKNLSIVYPRDFYYSEKQKALFPDTVFAMKYLKRFYPKYLLDILMKKGTNSLKGWQNVTGDIRIGYIKPGSVADEAYIMFFEKGGYLDRVNEYKSFGTMLNNCFYASANRIIAREYGYKYIPVKRCGMNAKGEKVTYTDYVKVSEQRHKFSEDGFPTDTWDLFPDSLRFYPYCKDTAETACNNIVMSRFYEVLTDEEKLILHYKKNGETNVSISKKIGKSHTIVNRKIDKMKRILKKELLDD